MALTYNSWLTSAADLLATTPTQANFVIEAPNAIDYAEQRLYRELDLVSSSSRDSSTACTPNLRTITLASGFIVLEDVSIITPAGSTPDNGRRNPMQKVTESFLDYAWPDVTGAAIPRYYAVFNPNVIFVGPWPDQGYVVEGVGTMRPAPLSNSNQSTFLSANLPDLFLCATMIHFSGAKKNYGAQADDPRMAVSWESQFEKLLPSANREEMRKRYQGTVMEPPPGSPPPAPAAAG